MSKDTILVLTKDKTPHEIDWECIGRITIDREIGTVEVVKKKRKIIETYPSKNMRLLVDGFSHKL